MLPPRSGGRPASRHDRVEEGEIPMRDTGARRGTARHAVGRHRPPRGHGAPRATAQPLGLTAAARHLPPSATLRMNELVAGRRAAGQETIHLGFGQASFPLAPPVRAALAEAATDTEYPPVLGKQALRVAIAGYLTRTRGVAVSADQVGVGPGSKALLFALLQVLDGDALVPVPSWVSYAPQVRLAGKRAIPVATDSADHLRLTP